MKKTLFFTFFFITAFFLIHGVAFSENTPGAKAPENFEEAKKVGEKTLDLAKNDLPGIIGNIWKNEVWPIWKKWADFLGKTWNNSSQKFNKIFQNEFNKRKPVIEEEFQKEKKELKEDIKTEVPSAGKSVWTKVKEIFK